MTDRRDEIAGELEKGMAETVSLKERPLLHLLSPPQRQPLFFMPNIP